MIHAIRLSGFKSFVEWTEVPLRLLTMLAGPNGAGKSTILQAVLLMKQTVEHPPADASLRLDGPFVSLDADGACSAHETVLEAEFVEIGVHRYRIVCAPDDRRGPGRLHIRELQHDDDRAVADAPDKAVETFAAHVAMPRPEFVLHDRRIAVRGATPVDEIRRRDVDGAVSAWLLDVLRRRLADGAFPGTNARERNHRARAVEQLDRGDLEAGAKSLLRIRSARATDAPPALPEPLRTADDLLRQQFLRDIAHLVDLEELARVAEPAPQQAFERVDYADWLSRDFFGFRARYSARSVLHLGPGRDGPRHLHDDVPVECPGDIDPKGALAVAYLHQHRDDPVGAAPWRPAPRRGCRLPPGCSPPGSPLRGGRPTTLAEAVDLWLRHLGIARELVVESRPPFGLTLGFRCQGDAKPLPAANAGAGLSGVLPVLVLGLAAEPYGTVIYEHPGAHLHPEVQRRLFDFFAALARDDVQVVVETHSGQLLDRARHDVAHRRIPAFNVGVVFVERDGSGSRVRHADTAGWARGDGRGQALEPTTGGTCAAAKESNG